jgi:hypothetical protein
MIFCFSGVNILLKLLIIILNTYVVPFKGKEDCNCGANSKERFPLIGAYPEVL